MEQDTRIGLALGILLIGVVGALFFRNERAVEQTVPEVTDPDALDARIAERPIGPYLSPRAKGEPQQPPSTTRQPAGKAWEVPGFLRNERTDAPPVISGPPEPIRRSDQIEPEPPTSDQEVTTVQVPPSPEIESPVTTPPEPEITEYTVQSGDTLSDIARKFLGSSARYMEIFELNKDRLKSPNDVRAGHALRVPRARQ